MCVLGLTISTDTLDFEWLTGLLDGFGGLGHKGGFSYDTK